MRKSLWIILSVLFVAIVTPNVHADTFTPTFTCTGTCLFLPTAPNVSFPAPVTMDVKWFNIIFPVTLGGGGGGTTPAFPTDHYTWYITAVNPPVYDYYNFTIYDSTSSVIQSITLIHTNPTIITDNGVLTFDPVATPEPSSLALMLAGLGMLVLVMRKRVAQGLSQAT
jgi:hypothetical protein